MSNIIEQSKNRIEQLLGISYEEAIDDVQTLISEKLNEEEINVAITGVEFTGSQRFGNPNEDSDLDVVFTYESIDERVKEDYLFNILNEEPIYYYGFKLDINPIEDGNIDNYILNASKYKKDLTENLQPFELEAEKDRIRDVLDIMKDVEYGFISQVDGKKITDRDWIHHCDLDRYYKVNTDPLKTIKDKLGICQDQSIAVKYLMNKLHPEDTVKLFTMTKSPIGHCVPCYCHNDKWYYIENSWDKEKGLHGYFESEDELKKYLKFIYFENHKDDTPKDSKVEVGKYTMPLTEDTRSQLTAASRNAGPYKGDTTRGKNRFERKKWSKVANQVRSYNQIDMNDFFKKDQLDIKIPVTGETKEYTVTLRLNGVCAEIAKNIKSNGNKFEYKTVVQALTKIFNTANVYVNCTCDDFKYRFNHWSVVNNYGTTDSAHDPGPGKGIANPADDKGKGCKHVLLTIANMDWLMKVASVIHNYINYIAEHKQAAFNQIIFPKLYGIPVNAAKENNLVPEETNLDTDKNLINTINDWAKNRGKIKPGTRVNPVTGTGGRAKAATPTITTAKPAATTPTKPAATTPAAETKPTNAQPEKEETNRENN